MNCPFEQLLQVFHLERFEHVYLAAREQRPYDLERGVLGGGSDECDRAVFDGSQQGVLLRLAESVYFVDEQNGAYFREDVAFAAVEHLAHLLDSRLHGAEGEKRGLQLLRNDVGQGGLAYTRRSPKDKRRNLARVNHAAQYGARAYQVFLPDVFIECPWTHPGSKRFIIQRSCGIFKKIQSVSSQNILYIGSASSGSWLLKYRSASPIRVKKYSVPRNPSESVV